MGTARIQSVHTRTTGMVVEVYEPGSDGQAPRRVATHVLGTTSLVAELGVGPKRHLVVREPTETIGNGWQSPPPAGDSCRSRNGAVNHGCAPVERAVVHAAQACLPAAPIACLAHVAGTT